MIDPPVLDRIPFFDPRSRQYPVRSVMQAPRRRRKRLWTPRPDPLDQGREGACVGFAWSTELATTPRPHTVTNASALALYDEARTQDKAMGNDWPQGASVLGGAKACAADGTIRRYYWAFGVQDVVDALVVKGPVVLGINWYQAMYETDANGLVRVDGPLVGGHAITATGFWPDHPLFRTDVVVWTNSWGEDYGVGGTGYIPVSSLAILLDKGGEACVPTDFDTPRKSHPSTTGPDR